MSNIDNRNLDTVITNRVSVTGTGMHVPDLQRTNRNVNSNSILNGFQTSDDVDRLLTKIRRLLAVER